MVSILNDHDLFFKIALLCVGLYFIPVSAHDNTHTKQLTKKATTHQVVDQKVISLQSPDKIVTNQTAKTFNLELKERNVLTGSKTIRVTQGDLVRLVWKSDESAKLHLHGYDIEFSVSTTKLQTIQFIANASGRFSITSHSFSDKEGHGHEALLYLEVYPE
jgi:hypothetical protein